MLSMFCEGLAHTGPENKHTVHQQKPPRAHRQQPALRSCNASSADMVALSLLTMHLQTASRIAPTAFEVARPALRAPHPALALSRRSTAPSLVMTFAGEHFVFCTRLQSQAATCRMPHAACIFPETASCCVQAASASQLLLLGQKSIVHQAKRCTQHYSALLLL